MEIANNMHCDKKLKSVDVAVCLSSGCFAYPKEMQPVAFDELINSAAQRRPVADYIVVDQLEVDGRGYDPVRKLYECAQAHGVKILRLVHEFNLFMPSNQQLLVAGDWAAHAAAFTKWLQDWYNYALV